ncbi:hypothetical protein PSH87_14315 [Pseudomonas sp. FP453]|uniref:hypothetical protein n=1 Tax=Pseudomonas sp. FP453 TaxID=2954094 RepID=UPI002733FC8F|nr:hypothetical protein [Pseudomonas sp. FP453]WLH87867.1 hypothetical protein PSH87_14315 [Pseudomonas sp. FP453]
MIDRNDVLDKAIAIESLMSILITLKFFPLHGAKIDFLEIMMNDESATTNYKRSVLMKCYPEAKGIDEAIRSVFYIRNVFAHSGGLVFHPIDGSSPINLDPRKPGQDIDLEGKLKKFNRDYAVVNARLFEILQTTRIIIE